MKISIVVPVYNEAENIAPLLDEIVVVMQVAEAYEIIYVNDGSDDHTAAVLADGIQRISELRVFQHGRSCGQSAAIYTGVKAAKYPVIATLDGDGQNDPADIPRLLTVLKTHNANDPTLWMVSGWRNKRQDSAWRLFSSKVANTVRAALLGDSTPDSGCGLKLFYRDAFLSLPYFNHMHRFLPALVIRAGGRVLSEPVNHRPRTIGYSKYDTLGRLGAGLVDLLGVIWLIKRASLAEVEEIERR